MIMKRIKTDCTGITESAVQDDEKDVTTSMSHEESEGKKKAVMTRDDSLQNCFLQKMRKKVFVLRSYCIPNLNFFKSVRLFFNFVVGF